MRAFIIRPFGVKKGIDFERVETELIGPALDRLGISGRTTGEILEAGNIRADMFQRLLVADLVVADISTNNANAFYELGIRHALQDKRTFLLRGRTLEQGDEVPFDLRTDRYLAYHPEKPADALAPLIEGLRQTLASDRADSPVFLSLPGLRAQDRSAFTPVPQDFREDVMRAAEAPWRDRLALYAMEVAGLPWEAEGLRVVGRVQFRAKYFHDAQATWEAVRCLDANDCEANLLLGTIYQRLGRLADSNLALARVTALATADASTLAEAFALAGSNRKQLWVNEWSSAVDLDGRRRMAFESPLLLDAYRQYRDAFRQDLNAYYPGINALALLVVFFELHASFADLWTDRFSDEAEADRELAALKRELEQLKGSVAFCVAANKARRGDSDAWLNVTEADVALLTSDRPKAVGFAFAAAARSMDAFMRDSVRRQMDMYAGLGVLETKVRAALEAVGGPDRDRAQESQRQKLGHVIVFAGHRVDDPGRKSPRFPSSCEPAARDAIRAAVRSIVATSGGDVVGLAGAASGGDILFHEVCRELGLRTEILLAVPADAYIAASVQPSGGDWVRRFYELGAGDSSVSVLSQTRDLPRWLSANKDYTIWQRNNLWLLACGMAHDAAHMTLIALWNGQTGDGPGGTEHMIRVARARDLRIEVLDTKQICGIQA